MATWSEYFSWLQCPIHDFRFKHNERIYFTTSSFCESRQSFQTGLSTSPLLWSTFLYCRSFWAHLPVLHRRLSSSSKPEPPYIKWQQQMQLSRGHRWSCCYSSACWVWLRSSTNDISWKRNDQSFMLAFTNYTLRLCLHDSLGCFFIESIDLLALSLYWRDIYVRRFVVAHIYSYVMLFVL